MSFGFFGSEGREFQRKSGRIFEEHLNHDLTPEDRNALSKARSTVNTYGLAGAIIGPLLGVGTANLIYGRRFRAQIAAAAQARQMGLPPRIPWTVYAVPLGFGLLFGLLGNDLAFALGMKQANDIIEKEGNPARIDKALRAASGEVLREAAAEVERSSARI